MSAVAWTPLATSLDRLSTLASPHTGLVRHVYEVLRAPDDARLFRVGADTAEGPELVGVELEALRRGTGGFDADRDAAVAAAIAEAAERYSACLLPEHDAVLATARRLGEEAVAPERFALFHPRQHTRRFPFRPFTRDTPVRWIRARALGGGAEVWLPAQLVYLGWPKRDEPAIGYATSNGLACGATRVEATVAALLELLERDAFMIAWNGRLTLPLLDWKEHAGLSATAARLFDPPRLRYAAVDLSAFWDVPTVLGVVHGTDVGAFGIGAGAAPTVEGAWRKALAEAFAVRTWARTCALENPGRTFAADYSDVLTFADHVALYASHEQAAKAAFLDASSDRRRVSDVMPLPARTPRHVLDALVRRLAAQQLTAYAVDVTAPDVREAGLSVVKVVVPELCQLDVAHRARYLGGTRLYEAAWQAGLRAAPLAFEDLNPEPHPFP